MIGFHTVSFNYGYCSQSISVQSTITTDHPVADKDLRMSSPSPLRHFSLGHQRPTSLHFCRPLDHRLLLAESSASDLAHSRHSL